MQQCGAWLRNTSIPAKKSSKLPLKRLQACSTKAILTSNIVDEQRIAREDKRQTYRSKGARTARRIEQMKRNELFDEAERLLYEAGIAD